MKGPLIRWSCSWVRSCDLDSATALNCFTSLVCTPDQEQHVTKYLVRYKFPSLDLKCFKFLSQPVQRNQDPVKMALHQFTARTMLSSVPVAVLQQWAVCDTDQNLLYGEIDFVLQAFWIIFCWYTVKMCWNVLYIHKNCPGLSRKQKLKRQAKSRENQIVQILYIKNKSKKYLTGFIYFISFKATAVK